MVQEKKEEEKIVEQVVETPSIITTTNLPIKKLITSLNLSEEVIDSSLEHLAALPNILPKTGSQEYYLMIILLIMLLGTSIVVMRK
jgi:LPXTG-motif cell wall-anchored protein